MYNLLDQLTFDAQVQAVSQSYSIGNEKAGGKSTKYTSLDGSIVDGSGDIFNINYMFVNQRLGLNWNYSDNINVYFLTGYTSREPRMGNLYGAEFSFYGNKPLFEGQSDSTGERYDFNKPLIKPEQMLDFELGTSYRSELVNFGINLYWMEYFDELVKSGRLDIFGNPIDGNAPRTRHSGIELQASALILNLNKFGKISISGNASISHNEILEYDFKTSPDEIISLAGNTVAGFPDVLGNLRLSWQAENVFLSLLGKYVGELRSDNFGKMLPSNRSLINYLSGSSGGYYADNMLPAYFIMNLDASFTFKDVFSFSSIRLQLQVSNLTNKLYAAGAEGKEFFPAAERSIFLGIDLQF
jgi:iron complex outermembrane receptor protein